jgi:hypothetical protein
MQHVSSDTWLLPMTLHSSQSAITQHCSNYFVKVIQYLGAAGQGVPVIACLETVVFSLKVLGPTEHVLAAAV